MGEQENEYNSEKMNENIVSSQIINIPPEKRDQIIFEPDPTIIETVVEIPHDQYIERIETKPIIENVIKKKNVPVVEVHERVIQIPKSVPDTKIVEVPHYHIIDNVVEVPNIITKEKIIEVPTTYFQERIIPIPNRSVHEKIVRVPKEEFDKIMEKYKHIEPVPYPQKMNPFRVKESRTGQPLPEIDATNSGSNLKQEIFEVAHTQRIYRNVMQQVEQHIPSPVEVPLPHYQPIPKETIIHRNVPIPVSLEVTQEFFCPRIIEKYTDISVPVLVNRAIEKAVPSDAMFNSSVMEAYLTGRGGKLPSLGCLRRQQQKVIPKERLSETELHKRGLNSQMSLSRMETFKSMTSNTANMSGTGTNFFNKKYSVAM